MTDFNASLTTVLDRLQKGSWQEPLHNLANNFDHYPTPEFDIREELLSMLWGFTEAHEADPQIPLSTFVAIRLPKLTSWTLRATNISGDQHKTWDPLTQPFIEFKDSSTHTTQATSAHPAEDIIKRWSRDNLK